MHTGVAVSAAATESYLRRCGPLAALRSVWSGSIWRPGTRWNRSRFQTWCDLLNPARLTLRTCSERVALDLVTTQRLHLDCLICQRESSSYTHGVSPRGLRATGNTGCHQFFHRYRPNAPASGLAASPAISQYILIDKMLPLELAVVQSNSASLCCSRSGSQLLW